MTILDKIIQRKRGQVAEDKQKQSVQHLSEMPLFQRTPLILRDFIMDSEKSGIIAEFKRASPSKGVINDRSTVREVVQGYQRAGVSAVSVLTDSDFFKGSLEDLLQAREAVSVPVLRKEFIIEEFQITQAKAFGADIILLIAAVLTTAEIKRLSQYAKDLGLSVLLEVHGREELQHNLMDTVDAVGVNNRNLKDFSVSIEHSLELAELIPDSFIKVSESGLSDPANIKTLKAAGYQGFLIGENFMKTEDPAQAIEAFTASI